MQRTAHSIRGLRGLVALVAAGAALALAGCGDDEPQPIRTSEAGGDPGTRHAQVGAGAATTPAEQVNGGEAGAGDGSDEPSATGDAKPVSWPAFVTPSGRFACKVFEQEIQGVHFTCDVRPQDGDQGYPKPNRPITKLCQQEAPDTWANAVSINDGGSITPLCSQGVNVTSRSLPTLAYGRTWSNAGFSCTSDQAALTCTNPDRSHRFSINREALTID